jgi:hypothetical protein
MTGIGGPGGIGPKGPAGLDPTQAGESSAGAEELSGAERGGHIEGLAEAQQARGASAASGPQGVDALAADIAAGHLTPQQAIDQLVAAAGAQLDPADRAEFREMLSDLFASDPHLRGLISNLSSR